MLHKIDDMLTEWSMAFSGGFRDILPVFIRCKSKNGVGGGPARHIVKNTIELFPRYFDMPPAKQSITMLHEMGPPLQIAVEAARRTARAMLSWMEPEREHVLPE